MSAVEWGNERCEVKQTSTPALFELRIGMEKTWKYYHIQLKFNVKPNSLVRSLCLCMCEHGCKTGKTLTSQFGAILKHFTPVAIANSMSM